MNDKPLLPIILVTGFLGSGKTTFVRHLLRDAAARGFKIGVVINEFGVADIDGSILRESGAEMLGSLAGGCACCSSADEMMWTMLEIGKLPREMQPDAIVLESSGMADPVVMLDCLTVAALLPHVRVASIVSLFDAHRLGNLRAQSEISPLLRRQAGLADWLIVNKSDIAFRADVGNVKRAGAAMPLRELNSHAPIEFTKGGAMDLTLLWQQVQSARRDAPQNAGEAVHGHAQSVVVRVPKPQRRARLEAMLDALGTDVWRAKGFVHLEGEGLCLVQYTGIGHGRTAIEPFDARRASVTPPSELVFIGPHLDRAALTREFGGSVLLAVL